MGGKYPPCFYLPLRCYSRERPRFNRCQMRSNRCSSCRLRWSMIATTGIMIASIGSQMPNGENAKSRSAFNISMIYTFKLIEISMVSSRLLYRAVWYSSLSKSNTWSNCRLTRPLQFQPFKAWKCQPSLFHSLFSVPIWLCGLSASIKTNCVSCRWSISNLIVIALSPLFVSPPNMALAINNVNYSFNLIW